MAKIHITLAERHLCAVLLCAALVGCIASAGQSVALYPDPEHRRAPTEVATLVGDVAIVDGKDVTEYGNSFELLPGCHLVATPSKWGQTGHYETMVANIGHVYFAIDMKAGYRYVLRIEIASLTGGGGKLSITAREEQSDGTVTRMFNPVKGQPQDGDCPAEEHRAEH